MLTRKNWSLVNNVILIVSVLILVIIGIIIGTAIKDWPLFYLKFEVDIVSIFVSAFSIISTLVIAYWVTTKLEKDKEINRVEKEIIIKRIDWIFNLIEETSNKVKIQEIDYSLASANIKRIATNTNSVLDIVKKTTINISNHHASTMLESLKKIKILLTDTPMQNESKNNLQLTVTDGIIHLTLERRLLIEAEFDIIKSHLVNLELDVNKG